MQDSRSSGGSTRVARGAQSRLCPAGTGLGQGWDTAGHSWTRLGHSWTQLDTAGTQLDTAGTPGPLLWSPGQPDPGEAPSVTGLCGHGLALLQGLRAWPGADPEGSAMA
ncbi:cortexin-1 isoform X1 [Prinia subflava]|uniref:cortexin-1 isoform X1 n=1 Tax=Prinia subflava TaxID=208062 RepID=UPI002FE1F0F9